MNGQSLLTFGTAVQGSRSLGQGHRQDVVSRYIVIIDLVCGVDLNAFEAGTIQGVFNR